MYIQQRPECRIKRGAFKSVKGKEQLAFKKSAFEEELGDMKGDPENLERTVERFSCVSWKALGFSLEVKIAEEKCDHI